MNYDAEIKHNEILKPTLQLKVEGFLFNATIKRRDTRITKAFGHLHLSEGHRQRYSWFTDVFLLLIINER